MRRLLLGTAPLRGRATLELVMPPFGYREAADFWDLAHDPDLAFKVNALVGGTPAYRAMAGGTPARADFDDWVAGNLLDPASAIFREGSVLLYEQPDLAEASVYFSVLGAIADGAAKRSEIAGLLGRPDSALTHPLSVLEELRLVAKVEDALRPRRPIYELSEPIIRFHQLLIRPREHLLAAGAGARVWRDAADTVTSKIFGPHMESICREWVLLHASSQVLGGQPNEVRPATIACREHGVGHEIDLVALSEVPHEPKRVLAIGEAKATAKLVGDGELKRLEHLRDLLPGLAGEQVKLLLFSRSGFTKELVAAAARRSDVELVDIERLYGGS
jgi:DNA-binding transcriptional ArsR family regulator